MLETVATNFQRLGIAQFQTQPLIDSVSVSCRPSRQGSLSEAGSASVRGRVARVESIRSVLDFVDFLSAIPEKFLVDLSSEKEVLRRLVSGTKIHSSFISSGLSFVVRTYTQPDLPAVISERLPSYDRQPETRPAIIAIKSPRTESSSGAFDENQQATALRAVAWECHVLTHPPIQASENIVRLLGVIWEGLEYGSAGHRMVPALAMEYADAGTLDNLIDSQEYSLTYEMKKKIVLDVALGLNDLHQSYFIHGDIKTDNVLLFTDAQGELRAKVADFGCAIHISRENKIVQLPGRSPPWDAPESQEDIPSHLLKQVDIYGWGLLVWRVMLNGRTPFDSGKRQCARGVEPFDRILSYDRRSDEFFHKAQELKLAAGDLFLECVILTLPDHGIDSKSVAETLSCALLRDPLKRARSFETISQVLRVGERPICSSPTLEMDALSLERPSEVNPEKRPFPPAALFSPVPKSQEPPKTAKLNIQQAFRESMQRANQGAEEPFYFGTFGSYGYPSHNLLQFNESATSRNLDTEVKHQMSEDYKRQAMDEQLRKYDRGNSAFNYALSILLYFNKEATDTEGLQWLNRAAELGCIQAQALTYRLHAACGVSMPSDLPVVSWLVRAATSGSQFALEDLAREDALSYQQVSGELGKGIKLITGQPGWVQKSEVNLVLPFEDIGRFKAELDTLLAQKINGYGSINDIKTVFGHGVAHIAACSNYVDALRLCKDMGADIDSRTDTGETPILSACRSGHVEAARFLLQCGSSTSAVDWLGRNVLHYLVHLPEEAAVELLPSMVQKGADPNQQAQNRIDTTPFVGEAFTTSGTPLHWAVAFRKAGLCAALLEHGADPLRPESWLEDWKVWNSSTVRHLRGDGSNPIFTSPLALAVELHIPNIIEVFLTYIEANNVDPGLNKRLFVNTAVREQRLKMMCLNGSKHRENLIQTIQLLQKDKIDTDLMGFSVLTNNEILVHHLLEQGFPIETIISGFNPLYMALTKPHGEIIMDLLRRGADPCRPPPACSAAAITMLALRPHGTRTFEVTKELISRGCTYKAYPKAHEILYYRAVMEGWDDVSDLLLQQGLVKEATDQELFRSLLVQNSAASLVGLQHLISIQARYATADPTLFPSQGANVYHYLLDIEEDTRDDQVNSRALRLLLKVYSGPSLLNASDRKRGWTPIHYGVSQGNHRAITVLLESGADPKAGDGTASLRALDRLLDPKVFPGGFKGISNRHRRARRHEENSIYLFLTFLRHERNLKSLPIKSFSVTQKSLEEWRSDEFINTGLSRGLPSAEREKGYSVCVSREAVSPTGRWGMHVVDSSGTRVRELGGAEFLPAFNALGEAVADDVFEKLGISWKKGQ
ncbi:MAG: hypothetical protein Q9165_005605 [Trypethelium subeluteriae]